MAKQLQFRRGTTAQNETFRGAQGEITIDTDKNQIRIHDGSVMGGYPLDVPENVVHKSGDEIITGLKTFKTTSPWEGIQIDNPYSTADVIPTENSGKTIAFRDKNGIREGYMEFWHDGDSGNRFIGIHVCKNDKHTTGIQIGYDNQEQIFTYAPTPATTSNDNNIATTAWVRNRIKAQDIPVGLIAPYGGTTAPEGWLMCNGQSVSRTTYETLFNKIGTAYGTGDGSTTFNLPNYTDRVAQGLGRGYLNAGLPNITGGLGQNALGKSDEGVDGGSGALSWDGSGTYGSFGSAGNTGVRGRRILFNANSSSTIYGNSTTVQPPAVKTYWIIKY